MKFAIRTQNDILRLEDAIRTVLHCEGQQCAFLQSAPYKKLRISWLLRVNQVVTHDGPPPPPHVIGSSPFMLFMYEEQEQHQAATAALLIVEIRRRSSSALELGYVGNRTLSMQENEDGSAVVRMTKNPRLEQHFVQSLIKARSQTPCQKAGLLAPLPVSKAEPDPPYKESPSAVHSPVPRWDPMIRPPAVVAQQPEMTKQPLLKKPRVEAAALPSPPSHSQPTEEEGVKEQQQQPEKLQKQKRSQKKEAAAEVQLERDQAAEREARKKRLKAKKRKKEAALEIKKAEEAAAAALRQAEEEEAAKREQEEMRARKKKLRKQKRKREAQQQQQQQRLLEEEKEAAAAAAAAAVAEAVAEADLAQQRLKRKRAQASEDNKDVLTQQPQPKPVSGTATEAAEVTPCNSKKKKKKKPKLMMLEGGGGGGEEPLLLLLSNKSRTEAEAVESELLRAPPLAVLSVRPVVINKNNVMQEHKAAVTGFLLQEDLLRQILINHINNRVQDFPDPITSTLVLMASSPIQMVFCEEGLLLFKTTHLPILPYASLLQKDREFLRTWLSKIEDVHTHETYHGCGKFSVQVGRSTYGFIPKKDLLMAFVYVMLHQGEIQEKVILQRLADIIIQRFLSSISMQAEDVTAVMNSLWGEAAVDSSSSQ
jgi:hypothetical protein